MVARSVRHGMGATLAHMDAATIDQLAMTHRHADGEFEMAHVDDERIDGLRLRQYACSCGFTAAVLTRVAEEQQGQSWPFQFRTAHLS